MSFVFPSSWLIVLREERNEKRHKENQRQGISFLLHHHRRRQVSTSKEKDDHEDEMKRQMSPLTRNEAKKGQCLSYEKRRVNRRMTRSSKRHKTLLISVTGEGDADVDRDERSNERSTARGTKCDSCFWSYPEFFLSFYETNTSFIKSKGSKTRLRFMLKWRRTTFTQTLPKKSVTN